MPRTTTPRKGYRTVKVTIDIPCNELKRMFLAWDRDQPYEKFSIEEIRKVRMSDIENMFATWVKGISMDY